MQKFIKKNGKTKSFTILFLAIGLLYLIAGFASLHLRYPIIAGGSHYFVLDGYPFNNQWKVISFENSYTYTELSTSNYLNFLDDGKEKVMYELESSEETITVKLVEESGGDYLELYLNGKRIRQIRSGHQLDYNVKDENNDYSRTLRLAAGANRIINKTKVMSMVGIPETSYLICIFLLYTGVLFIVYPEKVKTRSLLFSKEAVEITEQKRSFLEAMGYILLIIGLAVVVFMY